MAMSSNGAYAASRHRLVCGRSVEQVWVELEVGRISGHAAGCRHCSTARASLEQLAEATAELVADPVEPPPGLLDRIMSAVRAELTDGDPIPLPAPAGRVDISTHALAAVLRFAVDVVPGLRAHRCRIDLVPDQPFTVRVWMSVSLSYGAGRIDAVEAARARVRAVLSERIGLGLQRLDIELTDVWIDAPGRRA